jgi:hypothetical protein
VDDDCLSIQKQINDEFSENAIGIVVSVQRQAMKNQTSSQGF